MTDLASLPPPDERWFEHYPEGAVFEFGSVTITEAEIIEFATRFDPQYFHIDPVAAKSGPYGGLIASGWHTGSLFMRLLVDNVLPTTASLGGAGMEEVRWLGPVRPGDTLSGRMTVLKARASASRPDRGVVTSFNEVINHRGEVVMTTKPTILVQCRPA